MSTDRELLELAATAAGVRYDADASKPHPKSGAFWGLWLIFDGEPSEHARRYWNPLTDDGDALRLAVRLGLTIKIMGDHAKVGWQGCGEQWRGEEAPTPSELPAATRRAITRAAAAIAQGAAQEGKTP